MFEKNKKGGFLQLGSHWGARDDDGDQESKYGDMFVDTWISDGEIRIRKE